MDFDLPHAYAPDKRDYILSRLRASADAGAAPSGAGGSGQGGAAEPATGTSAGPARAVTFATEPEPQALRDGDPAGGGPGGAHEDPGPAPAAPDPALLRPPRPASAPPGRRAPQRIWAHPFLPLRAPMTWAPVAETMRTTDPVWSATGLAVAVRDESRPYRAKAWDQPWPAPNRSYEASVYLRLMNPVPQPLVGTPVLTELLAARAPGAPGKAGAAARPPMGRPSTARLLRTAAALKGVWGFQNQNWAPRPLSAAPHEAARWPKGTLPREPVDAAAATAERLVRERRRPAWEGRVGTLQSPQAPGTVYGIGPPAAVGTRGGPAKGERDPFQEQFSAAGRDARGPRRPGRPAGRRGAGVVDFLSARDIAAAAAATAWASGSPGGPGGGGTFPGGAVGDASAGVGDLAAAGQRGNTALHRAAARWRAAEVAALLAHHARLAAPLADAYLDARNWAGETALLRAIPRAAAEVPSGASPGEWLSVLRQLIAAGAAVDIPETAAGETPLHRAASASAKASAGGPAVRAGAVKALLHAGADVTLADAHGETALHKAVLHYAPAGPGLAPGAGLQVIQLLLDAGADPAAANAAGETPGALAARKGHASAAALLARARVAAVRHADKAALLAAAEHATRMAARAARAARPLEPPDRQWGRHAPARKAARAPLARSAPPAAPPRPPPLWGVDTEVGPPAAQLSPSPGRTPGGRSPGSFRT